MQIGSSIDDSPKFHIWLRKTTPNCLNFHKAFEKNCVKKITPIHSLIQSGKNVFGSHF